MANKLTSAPVVGGLLIDAKTSLTTFSGTSITFLFFASTCSELDIDKKIIVDFYLVGKLNRNLSEILRLPVPEFIVIVVKLDFPVGFNFSNSSDLTPTEKIIDFRSSKYDIKA